MIAGAGKALEFQGFVGIPQLCRAVSSNAGNSLVLTNSETAPSRNSCVDCGMLVME